jgi:hypothetical protein
MTDHHDDLQEELERANHERQLVVRKYKLGRKSENLINQWVRVNCVSSECSCTDTDYRSQEDPDFGLYYKIDR